MAFLNRGLTIILTDQRPDHINGEPRAVTYCYEGGIADFVRYLNATKEPVHATVIEFGEEGDGHLGRDRHAVERLLHRVGAHVRQHDQHGRGRHPRGGVPGRADHDRQQVRPRPEAAPGEGRAAHRRGRPRGPGRDHLGQAGQPAVRGPDQDQARQHRGQVVRAEGVQRPSAGLVRAQPGRGQGHHHQGRPGRPGPDRGPPGARPDPAQGRCWSRRRCRASWPTASPAIRRGARSTSSRATRPAARPRAAGTRSSRRSCRSAARSSTWRRPGSTGC